MEKTGSDILKKPRTLAPSSVRSSRTCRQFVEEALNHAGITINGDQPHDILVYNDHLYERVLREGSLGVGESYMDGWWDSPELDRFFDRIFRADLKQYFEGNWQFYLHVLKSRLKNLQEGASPMKWANSITTLETTFTGICSTPG